MNKIIQLVLLALLFILFLLLQCVLFGPSRVNKAYMLIYPLFFTYHLLLFVCVIIISSRVMSLTKQFITVLLLPLVISTLLGLGVYVALGGLRGSLMEFLYVTLYAPYVEAGGIIGSLPVALAFAIKYHKKNTSTISVNI